MKIAIEAQRIFRPHKHGMDFVALEAIKHLQKIDRVNDYYVFVAQGEDRCLEETANFRIVELRCPTYALWEQVALPCAVRRLKPDILHCTSNTAPMFGCARLVLTLHDIIFMDRTSGTGGSWYQRVGRYYRRFVVPIVVRKCVKIVTVSDFEHKKITDFFKLPSGKVQTIHNGYSKNFAMGESVGEITAKYLKEPEYIFTLGNTDPRKNVEGTLLAYGLYIEGSTRRLPLVVSSLSREYVERMADRLGAGHIKPYLRFSGYIKSEHLAAVYSGASVFVYASLAEGFGIPILEAMACGVPVVTSNLSSMPEVAGSGAMLVDPRNPRQIACAILALENDPQLRQRQVEYGLGRVKRFSWEAMAGELLEVYNSVNDR